MNLLLTRPEADVARTLHRAAPAPAPAVESTLRDLADTACRTACRTAALRGALLLVADRAGGRPVVAGGHGPATAELRARLARPALARLVHDALTDGAPAGLTPHPLVVVPVASGGRRLGVIVALLHREDRRPGGDQGRALQAVAEITAAALAQAEAVAADEERLVRARVELARTIHEEVVQRLFGASLVLSSDAPLGSADLELCCTEVQGALRDLRSILGESLRAPVVAPAGSLAATLRALGDEPDVVAICDGCAQDVAADQDAVARSVLAEAVRNARKHAANPQITVTARIRPDLVTLTVENDGAPAVPVGEPGLGLRLAATEALHADGLLEHGPTADGRWRVRLTLPNHPETA